MVRNTTLNYNILLVGKYDPFYDAGFKNTMVVKIEACLYKCSSLFTKGYVPEKWYKLNYYQGSHLRSTKNPLNLKGTFSQKKKYFEKVKAHPYFICPENFNLIENY